MDRIFINLGILFIILGIALILVPIIAKSFSSVQLEQIPWILLWVYKSDGFWFATSPILIIIGIIMYILWILRT